MLTVNQKQLEELYLSGNPLEKVHPDAMKECKGIMVLEMRDCAFLNLEGDLKFIYRLQNLTVRL